MVIKRSDVFIKWYKKLKDKIAKQTIDRRIYQLEKGNPGVNRFLGDISELKIDQGPGYRVYYKDTGKEIIILLCGGDKSTQQADIEKARDIAKSYELEEE